MRFFTCAIKVSWVSGFLLFILLNQSVFAGDVELQGYLAALQSQQSRKSGAYVLEKGEESLLARAWLSEQAAHSIDVQYFIWSSDNIGILAAEALLKAAERGVTVRVIVDDLMVDTDDEILLAFNAHPNVQIKVYNPRYTVGVSFIDRLINLLTGFREANQRMHDKVALFDNSVAVIGGRNMADEYYDYDHEYDFRDRDVLLTGDVAQDITSSFNTFWNSSVTASVDDLLKNEAALPAEHIDAIYHDLHEYAANPENVLPKVQRTLTNMTPRMLDMLDNLDWSDIQFISDYPGKNTTDSLEGGGRSTSALTASVQKARQRITIQSPYLVMPEGGDTLFGGIIEKGVKVRISTNSLASTDNLYAFGGYLNQREMLLNLGIEIFEFKPHPAIQKQLLERYHLLEKEVPIFAIHAKTMVIDGETLFIGTFNFDPRSANLNTEVGALISSPRLARQVEQSIETDMQPENSWNAKTDDPDKEAGMIKRFQALLFSLLPIGPLL